MAGFLLEVRLTRRRTVIAAGAIATLAGAGALILTAVTQPPAPDIPRVGFAYTGGSLADDLRAVNATAYYRYSSPVDEAYAAEADALGLTEIRLLRFAPACPWSAYGCWEIVLPEDVAAFAARRRGLVYALGNEPNLPGQDWCAGCQAYWDWYDVMWRTIKAADPSARIIGPSVFNWDSCAAGWCNGIANGYQWYAAPIPYDYIGLHVYPRDYCGAMVSWQSQARAQVTAAVALGRPIAITEIATAWPYCPGDNRPSAETRRENVRALVEWLRGQPVTFFLWFSNRFLDSAGCVDGCFGYLVEVDGRLSPEGEGLMAGRPARPAVEPALPAPGPYRLFAPVIRRARW